MVVPAAMFVASSDGSVLAVVVAEPFAILLSSRARPGSRQRRMLLLLSLPTGLRLLHLLSVPVVLRVPLPEAKSPKGGGRAAEGDRGNKE